MGELAKPVAGLPDNYEPEKGIKKIAVASAAEEHWRRAMDAEKLFEAIEIKLTEQRRFVTWYDEAKPTGRPEKGNSAVTLSDIEGAPLKMTLSRWRSRLIDLNKFAEVLAKTQEKCRLICEAKGDPFAKIHGNEIIEWYTPEKYICSARKAMGSIDLDPATSEHAQKTVRAKKFFTVEDDCFEHEWAGSIWLNPPFNKPSPFIERLVEACWSGSQAILLTNNNTDTKWWQLAASNSSAVCFTDHRIKFYNIHGDESSPTNGQTFFFLGSDAAAFTDEFKQHGLIMRRHP